MGTLRLRGGASRTTGQNAGSTQVTIDCEPGKQQWGPLYSRYPRKANPSPGRFHRIEASGKRLLAGSVS